MGPRDLAHDSERVVLQYDRLACALAQKFRWCGEDLDDLIQVAREALIGASRRFEPRRGVRFMTYAYSVIWGRLMRYVRDEVRLIRHPRQDYMRGRPYLRMISLETLLEDEPRTHRDEAAFAVVDPGFDAVDTRLTLHKALARLTETEKTTLATRALQGTRRRGSRVAIVLGSTITTLRRRAIRRSGQNVA